MFLKLDFKQFREEKKLLLHLILSSAQLSAYIHKLRANVLDESHTRKKNRKVRKKKHFHLHTQEKMEFGVQYAIALIHEWMAIFNNGKMKKSFSTPGVKIQYNFVNIYF